MREIKFRAWLKEPKIMTEVKGFTEFENKIPYSRGKFVTEKSVKVVQNENINALWWCYERDDGEETECEIMQFTGLKDKKGKEIYEGDIVKIGNKIYRVFYNDGSFRVIERESRIEHGRLFELISMSDKAYCEVIGNIYENQQSEAE